MDSDGHGNLLTVVVPTQISHRSFGFSFIVHLGTSYFQIGGTVVDADPRTISNLISDQTASNPAAQEVFDALKGVHGGGTITGKATP